MKTPAPISSALSGDTARMRALVVPEGSTVPAQEARAPAPAEAKPLAKETLEAIASRIQEYLQRNGRNLEFRVDDASGRTVISVRDAHTGELIRQIPNEEALAISQRLSATTGTLFDSMV
jgi:flagellar protein FlaG